MGWAIQYGQEVGMIGLFSWPRSASGEHGFSGWDGQGCQSCVLFRLSRLLTGQDVWGGMVVGKVKCVGAVHLVDWLDG